MIATRSVVEAEFGRALRSRHSNKRNSVLLLRAAPEWRGDREFSVTIGGDQVPVAVAPCPTVLAVLDAMGAAREDGRYLVILTPCDSRDVGDSVLARAMQPEIKPINRWDLVADAFGARGLDPALTRSDRRWVAEALLDAQPPGGWRRLAGPVLTEAAALNRLTATRLGIEDADGSAVDAAALLQWSTHPDAVASFLQLRETERDGLIQWLDQTAAPVAGIVFAMAGPGKLTDAVPFGLAIAALYSDEHPAPDTLTARIRAEERYLGGHSPGPAALVAFGVAAESLVARWTDNGRAPQAAEQCERAEAILRDLAGSRELVLVLAAHSSVLEAGLDARLGALGDAISAALANPVGETLAAAAKALDQVYEHGRTRDRTAEIRTAEAALRLTRWLASAEEPPTSLAEAATRMLRSWAWADRALVGLSRADTSRVPGLGAVYASLWNQAKARRARLDHAFARKLAAWTQGSSDPDGLLLVENMLDRVVRPLARQRPPVVVVLDGMTIAAGCEIAEELTADGTWLEVGRRSDGREPVLATVPSVTAVSRTSLLTGTLRSGGQAEERSGFAEFWGRHASALFHKADLEPEPADCLSLVVRKAIADPDTVVGVVLNAIDDTLAKDRPGGPRHWTVADATYLGAILDEARRAGRPVILTADHGHVLASQQDPAPGQPERPRSESSRYRTGTPGPGEITIQGPRVMVGGRPGGEVVAAVDEAIHYTPKRAGYHGGASPAEVVVPVVTLLPSASLCPPGWHAYDAAGHAPLWWHPPVAASVAPAQPPAIGPTGRKRQAQAVPDDGSALFALGELVPAAAASDTPSLGAQIVASPRMASQREFVRRAPDDASVAALIDGLERAGRKASVAEAAEMAGKPPVRMSGFLPHVARLLNVDGYPVLRIRDDHQTVELNIPLLREQFLGE
ncbi:MAG: BREX-2 system phosphatase PglZ [Streptosporangiaceae bacterium]